MSSTLKQQDLERIRDNQRRSRARRRVYLQELEARLRNYQLHGIQASSEIQQAARRVIDENTKLRNLLAQIGIGDDAVVAYLQTTPTSDNQRGVVPLHMTEQPHQIYKSSYLETNMYMPANFMASGPGSLDASIDFSNVNLGVYLPADSKPLGITSGLPSCAPEEDSIKAAVDTHLVWFNPSFEP